MTYEIRRRKQKEKSQQVRTLAIAGLSLSILIGVVILNAVLQPEPVGDDLCPASKPVAAHMVVVLDATDAFSEVQKHDIIRRFALIQADVPEGGRLSLYRLDSAIQKRFSPLIALCNPGRGRGRSGACANPRLLEMRWEREFSEPLGKSIESLVASDSDKNTPILEGLQVIAVKEFPLKASGPKELIIFSDMLQHSDAFSHYAVRQEGYHEALGGSAGNRLKADLRGVHVRVFYIRRSGRGGQVQGFKHIRFWEDYFSDAGAVLEEVVTIMG